MGMGHAWVKKIPLTTSLIYLIVGIFIGPLGFSFFSIDPLRDFKLLEHLTEIAVLFSLFTAGLKLKLSYKNKNWQLPVALALVSMSITVVLVAGFAYYLLALPLGACILLGGILAPTDPVLASDVQVQHPRDEDHLRLSLTCEAGLNDGTAFPFVMLGIALLQGESLQSVGQEWIWKDFIKPVGLGIFIGWVTGLVVGKIDQHVRHKIKDAVVLDDFLGLALISLSYGAAIAFEAYGFLAVFTAAVVIRQLEHKKSQTAVAQPQGMAKGVLKFNEQFERICEVGLVILLGGMMKMGSFRLEILLAALVLLLVIRPLAVGFLALFIRKSAKKLAYISWFGIRGIGSMYYLMYSLNHGIDSQLGQVLVNLVFGIIAVSIILHGISVTPLMARYHK